MKETNPPKNGAGNSDIPALYEMMLEENLEELEIKDGDSSVHIRRKGAVPPQHVHVGMPVVTGHGAESGTAQVSSPQQAGAGGDTIKSPIIGVFYRSSSPGAAPFANEGDVVATGKTLCIVEAMKVMNEIKADCRQRIVKILVENGKPITAGQDLFSIEKL